MDDVPVSNPSGMMMYVGGHMIPPGETRLLPAHHVPEHLWPAAAPAEAAPPDDPLADLLKGTVKSIAESLPFLDDDELMEAEGLEALRESPRKGVLEAMAAERLKRASASDGDGD